MAFRATIIASIIGYLTGAPDVGDAKYTFDDSSEIRLALGTGADQANAVYADDFSIPSGGTLSIDLAGGVTSALGQVYTFTAIKAIKVEADDGNTLNIVVGGAASNAFVGPFADATDKIAVKPGGVALLADPSAAGWAVTPATGDILLLANSGSGSAVDGRIIIIGEA